MPIIHAGDQEFHLSHDEEDKLNQFQGITNFAEEDLPLVIKLLQNHSWHIEPAISRYFDDNWKESLERLGDAGSGLPSNSDNGVMEFPTGRTPSPVPRPSPPALGPRPEMAAPGLHSRFSVLDEFQATRNLVPILPIVRKLPIDYRDKFKVVGLNHPNGDHNENPVVAVLLLIPGLLWKLVTVLLSILTFGLLNDNEKQNDQARRVPKLPISETNTIDSSELLKNIADDSMKTKLKALLDAPRLEFNDALKECEEGFKFLLVVLLGDVRTNIPSKDENGKEGPNVINDNVDPNSVKFINRVFGNEDVLNLIEEQGENILLYVGSVTELEPWLVARNLNVKYTPECLVIGNVLNGNGSMNGVTRLSMLSKIRINSSCKLYRSLRNAIDRYNGELVVSRTEKEELRMAREIKQLQEQAYQDSLRKDQMKEETRKIEAEERAIQEKLKLEKEQDIKLSSTIENLKWLKQCITSFEKSKIPTGSDSKLEKCATLQIRTSSGSRIIKKFQGDATLHSVYCDIGCRLYLNNIAIDEKNWTEGIMEKIRSLMEDESVLCFKDLDIVEEDFDKSGFKDIIESELKKWDAQKSHSEPLTFNFELVSPFPRFRLPTNDHTKVREVSQIWPNGSLLVEDILESDSEVSDSE
ncbi:Ubx2 protein [Maudiozyma humilis]|uniref:Ubx2 protein n=1 Tax=Maudiozyma humilis TaxID=51915 RepID=A0AAV5RSJ8_MAUHU|nr:Ubx2 protein [Kazachstania humilis]